MFVWVILTLCLFTPAGGGCGKSSVVGKVVELSRKNRSLSAELTSEQHKVKQLEEKLKNLTCEHKNMQLPSVAKSLLLSNCDEQDAKVNVNFCHVNYCYGNRQLLYLKNSWRRL